MSMLAPFSFLTVTYGIAIPSPCYRVLTDKFVNRENGTTLSCSGALSRKGTKPVAPFRRSKLRSGSRSQHHDVRRKRCALRAGAQSMSYCPLPTRQAYPMARRIRHRYRGPAEYAKSDRLNGE